MTGTGDAPAPLELTFDGERSELEAGARLGNWTLRAEIGAGGMGRVFLADRSDGHYQQQAAIKVLLGWNSDDGLEQLARERQILANLQHPNIARLIDGGTTPLGRPYLVMDYVEGLPIQQYCREQKLDLAGVLALFHQVLDAVAYAHQQLVVHCDLKPGNVLVTPEGRAMLLDFGIARLQGGSGDTVHDVLTWTPRYASPEQRRGAAPGVTSDIYSLGRMLEDLLQLQQPLPPRQPEWRAVVARACAEEPARRYPTVVSLAEDLRRFAAHRPVRALPQSSHYVTAKLLRRRWPWAGVSALVVLLTVVFTLRLVQERDRAQVAERQALTEAATTRAVSDFVVSLFEGADPAVTGQKDMPARLLIERGRERIDSELPEQPALQAAMKSVLGKVYENIGSSTLATELYRQAAELEGRPDVNRPAQRAALLSRLANVLANDGRSSDALVPARDALALLESQSPVDPLALADALNTLGWVETANARFADAEAHLNRSLELRIAGLPADSPLIGGTLHNLGLMHSARGQLAQAEQSFRRALAVKQQRRPEGHPALLGTLESLGRVLAQQPARLAEAEALFRRALDGRRRLYGEDSPSASSATNELASVLQDAGRTAEAVVLYRDAARINLASDGPRTMRHAFVVNNLATALEELGDIAGAEAAFRDSLAVRQALLKPGDAGLPRAQHNLGRLLLRSGRSSAARPLIESATAARSARLPAGHRDRVDSLLLLAELELAEGRVPAAADAVALVLPHDSMLTPLRRAALRRQQALLAAAQGRGAEALSRHDEALRLAATALPAAHPGLQRFTLELALAAQAEGDAPRSRALLQALWPQLTTQPAEAPMKRQAQRLQAVLARDSG